MPQTKNHLSAGRPAPTPAPTMTATATIHPSYTPLEGVLFFNALRFQSVSQIDYDRISEELIAAPAVANDAAFQKDRLMPDALRHLYTSLASELVQTNQDGSGLASPNGMTASSPINPRKRKQPSPGLQSAHKPASDAIPVLLLRFYHAFRDSCIAEIKQEEAEYARLTREADEIERGEWDEKLKASSKATTPQPTPSVDALTSPVTGRRSSRVTRGSESHEDDAVPDAPHDPTHEQAAQAQPMPSEDSIDTEMVPKSPAQSMSQKRLSVDPSAAESSLSTSVSMIPPADELAVDVTSAVEGPARSTRGSRRNASITAHAPPTSSGLPQRLSVVLPSSSHNSSSAQPAMGPPALPTTVLGLSQPITPHGQLSPRAQSDLSRHLTDPHLVAPSQDSPFSPSYHIQATERPHVPKLPLTSLSGPSTPHSTPLTAFPQLSQTPRDETLVKSVIAGLRRRRSTFTWKPTGETPLGSPRHLSPEAPATEPNSPVRANAEISHRGDSPGRTPEGGPEETDVTSKRPRTRATRQGSAISISTGAKSAKSRSHSIASQAYDTIMSSVETPINRQASPAATSEPSEQQPDPSSPATKPNRTRRGAARAISAAARATDGDTVMQSIEGRTEKQTTPSEQPDRTAQSSPAPKQTRARKAATQITHDDSAAHVGEESRNHVSTPAAQSDIGDEITPASPVTRQTRTRRGTAAGQARGSRTASENAGQTATDGDRNTKANPSAAPSDVDDSTRHNSPESRQTRTRRGVAQASTTALRAVSPVVQTDPTKVHVPATEPRPRIDVEKPRVAPRLSLAANLDYRPRKIEIPPEMFSPGTSPVPSRKSEASPAPPVVARHDTIHAARNFSRTSAVILNQITSHRHAGPFQKPVSAKEVEGYQDIIKRPQDLRSIKTMITAGSRAITAALASSHGPGHEDSGRAPTPTVRDGSTSHSNTVVLDKTADLMPPRSIINSAQLEKEVLRVFANAVMFTPGNDGIVSDAREMAEDVESMIRDWRNVERQSDAGPGEVDYSGIDDSLVSAGGMKRRKM